MVEIGPTVRRTSFAAQHLDPLLGSSVAPANGHSPMPTMPLIPVPQAGDKLVGGPGIIITEPVRPLMAPPVPQAMSNSASHEDFTSDNTPLADTPTYVDDASFYPEEEVDVDNGVSV
jgi:hypothetical protein